MSGVVASALMNTPLLRDAVNILGVREAGTASIMRMFDDGFQVNIKAGYVNCEKRSELFSIELINRSPLPRYVAQAAFVFYAACAIFSTADTPQRNPQS